MSVYFFDSSALVKQYQPEVGTARVDRLLAAGPGVVSRLAAVEVRSAFAKRLRAGQLSAAEFARLCGRVRRDDKQGRLDVVRVLVRHFDAAERLIERMAPAGNLRTLDALQLAVALDLHEPADPITFVSADQALCGLAAAEGLAVVNPDVP